MATIASTQLNLFFQTLDEMSQKLPNAMGYVTTISTKTEEAIEKGDRKNIRTLISLELHNLHWCLKNLVQLDERLNCTLRNFELIG
jgi:hypothetical protein